MPTIHLTEAQLAALCLHDRQPAKRADRPNINDSRDIYDQVKHLSTLSREHCVVLTIDARHRLIAFHEVCVGTADLALVMPREVFRPAVLDAAITIAVVHNHPSGDPEPSEEDRLITKRLVTAGKVLGISVLDHLIVGDGRYFSFEDEGQL